MFGKRASKAFYSLQNHLFFPSEVCRHIVQSLCLKAILAMVFCFPVVLVSIAERSPMNFMLTLKASTFSCWPLPHSSCFFRFQGLYAEGHPLCGFEAW